MAWGFDRRRSTDLKECLQGKRGMAKWAEEKLLQQWSGTNTTSAEIGRKGTIEEEEEEETE